MKIKTLATNPCLLARAYRVLPAFRWITHLLLILPLAASAGEMWVQGSWVNVRETAEPQSAVIDHVTVNTKVDVVEQYSKMCEITWQEKRGFVACSLLGKKPLTLAEVTNAPDGYYVYDWEALAQVLDKNPNYSPLRAFWIFPSIQTLLAAGDHLEVRLRSPQQLSLERNATGLVEPGPPPPIVRYPVPEFEAMKAMFAKGIVVGAGMDPPLVNCRQARQTGARRLNDEYWEYPGRENFPYFAPLNRLQRLLSQVACDQTERLQQLLPKIRPSFFKNDKDIVPGSADIEQISAHFGIAERLRVLKGPRWVISHYDPRHLEGSWDIGLYELKLDQPVFEHVIGADGRVGVYEWSSWTNMEPDYYTQGYDKEYGAYDIPTCGYDWAEGESKFYGVRRGKTLLPGRPDIGEALFWFQSRAPLPPQKAKVSRREAGGIVVHEVDLDDDGVADFARWEQMEDEFRGWRVVFVNLNGEWYPFEHDIHDVCTGG
jgi:hypothetical protein